MCCKILDDVVHIPDDVVHIPDDVVHIGSMPLFAMNFVILFEGRLYGEAEITRFCCIYVARKMMQ